MPSASDHVARHADLVGEAAARRTLRAQIARLESELAGMASHVSQRDGIVWSLGMPARGPRVLGLGDLEEIRDALAERLRRVRLALDERAAREARARELLERMLRDPAAYRFVRITRAAVGEPGCGAWESRPRLGLVGMLAGWWHVTLSSGCPLAGRRRLQRHSLALAPAGSGAGAVRIV